MTLLSLITHAQLVLLSVTKYLPVKFMLVSGHIKYEQEVLVTERSQSLSGMWNQISGSH